MIAVTAQSILRIVWLHARVETNLTGADFALVCGLNRTDTMSRSDRTSTVGTLSYYPMLNLDTLGRAAR
ncbi:MAG: hypothetical protein HXY34_04770 [Candidatus Thorarchaeota archaeon]|nr:hypothetical protein [Candidatus Thorarchaeota archaeon]